MGTPLVDTDFLYSLIKPDWFVELYKLPVEGAFLDLTENSPRMPDKKAVALIKKTRALNLRPDMQGLDSIKKDEILHKLLSKCISIRQLRVPRGYVEVSPGERTSKRRAYINV